ncbi:MAG: DUF1156 domain-containing protein [Myxococcales bacterium]|nr:DUF1156 domain-containing protein [Myxococcales bacterium]
MNEHAKLIEVALPLDAINAEGAKRKRKAPKGYPTQIHGWWAQRPVAAARAVLFAQLVDDPVGDSRFSTPESQEAERQRLFDLLARYISWEHGNDPEVITRVRAEVALSHARRANTQQAQAVLTTSTPDAVNEYLATQLPPLTDPFAGGGTIPLEAQRLGLRVLASDLNPIAFVINQALVGLPARFARTAPVSLNPEERALRPWTGSQGLACDVRNYGSWVLEETRRQIGKYFPDIVVTPELASLHPSLKRQEGKALRVAAWLWARTVASPNPAMGGVHVPLLSTFWLSTKSGKEVWLRPEVNEGSRTWELSLHFGAPPDPSLVNTGTRAGKAQDFYCLMSKAPIEREYIRQEGKNGRLGKRLIAVVASSVVGPGRVYLPADSVAESMQAEADARELVGDARESFLSGSVPSRAMITGGVCSAYGLQRWGDLFLGRQILALTTLSDSITAVREKIRTDAVRAGMPDDHARLPSGGVGAQAYAEAVSVYLAAALSRTVDYGSTLATWRPKDNAMRSSLPRQAFAMTWDFAEGNPFGDSSSGWEEAVHVVANCLEGPAIPVVPTVGASISQADARSLRFAQPVISSTDPPYYDNISYAELSDFFYVWLRRTLKDVFPAELGTVLVPKASELIANAARHGDRQAAEQFFEDGVTQAISNLANSCPSDYPATIYYAFKQAETEEDGGAASTGWEKFLEGVVRGGFKITGTWPLRTEGDNRQNAADANALASSIVLACRRRPEDAGITTRAEFRRLLRAELPSALRALQQRHIAPVDVAQAAIGPGMAIFSQHSKVLEADGSSMTVRSALQLINEVLDEYLSKEEGEADAVTRFALTWFESYGWNTEKYGVAETLATAKNVSVARVVSAGVGHSSAGKFRLLKPSELSSTWDPQTDDDLTLWESALHLLRRLEVGGETDASVLVARLGQMAQRSRELAYRLFSVCERRGWVEDARAFNGLVTAWPELERLAASSSVVEIRQTGQLDLTLADAAPPKPRRAKSKRGVV